MHRIQYHSFKGYEWARAVQQTLSIRQKAACRVCENLKIQQVALFLEAAYDSGGSTKPASPFLSCVSILTRDTDIAILSARLSVRHVPLFYENGLTYCHTFLTTRSLISLVL